MASNVNTLVSELRRQGWDCSINADATRWKAIPPEKDKRLVTFANHPREQELVQITRELRQQGFVWPPHANGHLDAAARVTSTPFAPKPNPASMTLTTTADRQSAEETVGRIIAAVMPRPATPPLVIDCDDALAFASLREAKEYERLAAAELVQCNKEVAAASARAADARRAYDDAAQGLQKARAVFDTAFGAELAPEQRRAQ